MSVLLLLLILLATVLQIYMQKYSPSASLQSSFQQPPHSDEFDLTDPVLSFQNFTVHLKQDLKFFLTVINLYS